MAPVSNTITSTTSATQDLEVFKNYPTEKNNKLLQQKYGSQDEFFKQIQAEGYAEGFKGQELNLPATQMLDETAMNQYLDPSGINNIDDTHVMSQEHSDEIMNQFDNTGWKGSAFPGGFNLNYPEYMKTSLAEGKNFSQPGGLSGMTNEGKNLVKLDDGLTYSAEEMSARGYSDSQITQGLKQGFLDGDPENMEVFNNFINNQGISSVHVDPFSPQDMNIQKTESKTGIDTIDTDQTISGQKEKSQFGKEWEIIKKGGKWLLNALIEGGNLSELGWMNVDEGIAKGVDAIAKNYEQDKRRLEKVKMNSDIWLPLMEEDSGGYMSQWGLPFVNPDGKMWFYDSDKKAKIPVTGGNILVDPRVKELFAREKVMKDAEEKAKNEPFHVKRNAPLDALDDYILKQKKNEFNKKNYVDDEGLHITVDVGQEAKTGEPGSGRATDTGGLLEVQRRKMDQLMKKAETNRLDEEDKTELTNTLKEQGVETKGMNDKALLATTIGFGIMASGKPGLQGIGEGGVTGLKLAADIKGKWGDKSSDIQMITVKNDKGENVIVKYNKKKGTYEETGLKSPTTGTQTKAQQLEEIGAMANIPKDVMATAYYENMKYGKGKSRDDQILYTMSIIKGLIPEMTKDAEGLKDAATKIVDGMGLGLSLDELTKSLGL